MYHKKTFTLSIPLLFIILVYSCKPSDKISEEDYKIINVMSRMFLFLLRFFLKK